MVHNWLGEVTYQAISEQLGGATLLKKCSCCHPAKTQQADEWTENSVSSPVSSIQAPVPTGFSDNQRMRAKPMKPPLDFWVGFGVGLGLLITCIIIVYRIQRPSQHTPPVQGQIGAPDKEKLDEVEGEAELAIKKETSAQAMDSKSSVNHKWAFALLGVTVAVVTVYFSVWVAVLKANALNQQQLWCLVAVKLTLRSVVRAVNFLLGWFVVLPRWLGMDMTEVDALYSSGPIPTKNWLQKYDEGRIKIRDGLQRKLPNLTVNLTIVFFYSHMIGEYGITAEGEWKATPQVIPLSNTIAVTVVACVNILTFNFASDVSWGTWIMLNATWGTSPRIRDGDSRFGNISISKISTVWGKSLTNLLWLFILVPIYPVDEHAMLMQMCHWPSVGDCMAEVCGCLMGKHLFTVPFSLDGAGESKKKSWEGTIGMWLFTLGLSLGSLLYYWDKGDVTSASLGVWIALMLLYATLNTCTEVISPRSTDNFTIPIVAISVLAIAGTLMHPTHPNDIVN